MEKGEKICIIILNRPEVRNAVDGETARKLAEKFREFDEDEDINAAVLWGKGGNFCSGADLKAFEGGSKGEGNPLNEDMSEIGPMGPTRMKLSNPVIAAISGYAVAGGLELACWCDLRVMEKDATVGLFNRRFGVPLIDGGTKRLPRLIGMSNALDMVLTGRPVDAEEARSMGFANRIVESGEAREEAEKIARRIAEFPQDCLRNDRATLYEVFDLDIDEALKTEFQRGIEVFESGEPEEGARRFSEGEGRHGEF